MEICFRLVCHSCEGRNLFLFFEISVFVRMIPNSFEISLAVFFHIPGIHNQFNNLRNSLFLDSWSCFCISTIFLSANHGNLRITLSVSNSCSLYRSDIFCIIL